MVGAGEADARICLVFWLPLLDGGVFEWNRKETHCEGINGVCQPARAIEKKGELQDCLIASLS